MYLNENTGMRPVIVPISGKAESGKDFTAATLREQFEKKGRRAMVVHYADMLKFACRQFYGWNGEKDEVGRALLQYVGTEIYRSNNMHFWVEHLISFFDKFKPNDHLQVKDFSWAPPEVVIVPDARFPNEILGWVACGYPVVPLAVTRFDIQKGDAPEAECKELPSTDGLVDVSEVMRRIENKMIKLAMHENHLSESARQHASETSLDPFVFNVDGHGMNPNIKLVTDVDVRPVATDLGEDENAIIVRTAVAFMKMHTQDEISKTSFRTSELQVIPFQRHLDNVFKAFLEKTMRFVVNITDYPAIAQYEAERVADDVCKSILGA